MLVQHSQALWLQELVYSLWVFTYFATEDNNENLTGTLWRHKNNECFVPSINQASNILFFFASNILMIILISQNCHRCGKPGRNHSHPAHLLDSVLLTRCLDSVLLTRWKKQVERRDTWWRKCVRNRVIYTSWRPVLLELTPQNYLSLKAVKKPLHWTKWPVCFAVHAACQQSESPHLYRGTELRAWAVPHKLSALHLPPQAAPFQRG